MDAPETSSAASNKQRNQQQQQHPNRPRREFHSKNHSVQKRPVSKPFARKCDIYVSNKSNFQVNQFITQHNRKTPNETNLFVTFQAQMKQCQEILETEDTGEVFLHCLGNAIKRGITLALKLVQESDNRLGYEANTSTIDLIGMQCISNCDLIKNPNLILIEHSSLFSPDDLHPLNDEEDFSVQKRKNSCLHIRIFRHSNNSSKKTPA